MDSQPNKHPTEEIALSRDICPSSKKKVTKVRGIREPVNWNQSVHGEQKQLQGKQWEEPAVE